MSINKKISATVVTLMTLFLLCMIYVSCTKEKTEVGVAAHQFSLAAFEAVKSPLNKDGLASQKFSQKTKKIYKSIVPLRADGRYEIKGGELDWKAYNFNGDEEVNEENFSKLTSTAKLPSNFPLAAAKLVVDYFEKKSGCYAFYDLNANGKEEIVVQSTWGSGGLNYLFLEQQKDKWKVIYAITGGFVLDVKDADIDEDVNAKYSNKYWRITHWHRSGNDLFQSIAAYRNGAYEDVSTQSLPFAVQDLIYANLKDVDAACNDGS